MKAHDLAVFDLTDAIDQADQCCQYAIFDWEREFCTYVLFDGSVLVVCGPITRAFDDIEQAAEDWYNRSTKAQLLAFAERNGTDISDGDRLREDWNAIIIDAYAHSLVAP